MGGQIGAVALEFDLYWPTQFEGKPVATDSTALDGSSVTVMLANGSGRGVHKFKFTWATQEQINTLRGYANNPTQSVTISVGSGGASMSARFVSSGGLSVKPAVSNGDDGFSACQVTSTNPLNLFDGEITVNLPG